MAVPTFFLDHPIRLRVTLEFHPVESLRSTQTFINSQGIDSLRSSLFRRQAIVRFRSQSVLPKKKDKPHHGSPPHPRLQGPNH